MRNPPQQPDRVPGHTILGVGIGVIVSIVIGLLAAWGIADCTANEPAIAWNPSNPPRSPAEVNAMETAPFSNEAQGIEMHGHAARLLTTYGWVDRDRGIVHVPIDVAFDLLLARERQQGGAR